MDRLTSNTLADEAARILGAQQMEERHFDVYVATWPENFSGGQHAQPVPALLLLSPPPRVLPKETVAITEGPDGSVQQAMLERIEIRGISRSYADTDLRGDYWLVVTPGLEVTPEVAATIRPRYKPMRPPEAMQDFWTVVLKEER
jgi:hypothetical protein